MLEFLLQLFADGGDGGDGASSTGEGATMGEEVPAGIPDRAKKYYQRAVAKTNGGTVSEQTTPVAEQKEGAMSYEDLIKSEEYKDAHKAYMDKTIGERLKKYKGVEGELGKAKEMLSLVAQKYNVDPTAEGFMDALSQAIEADDSYYEDYAMEHDISTEDARKMVTMERKLRTMEAEREAAAQQEAARQQILILQQNAEKTKQIFPNFNLEVEMQDERFRRMCAVTGGDTTAAYTACHHQDIIYSTARQVSREAQIATTNAIASGSNRPAENGLTQKAPSKTEQSFKGMSLQQIRDYAAEQRRLQRK